MVPIEAHSWTISVIPELLSTFRVAAHRGSATIHITTCGHPISSHGWPVASLAMHAIFVIEVSSLLASSFVVLGAKGHSAARQGTKANYKSKTAQSIRLKSLLTSARTIVCAVINHAC